MLIRFAADCHFTGSGALRRSLSTVLPIYLTNLSIIEYTQIVNLFISYLLIIQTVYVGGGESDERVQKYV